MLALLEAFPAGEPVVVLLDNLESVMDTERETLAEPALHEALSAVLTAPAHAVTVIATTRVTPTGAAPGRTGLAAPAAAGGRPGLPGRPRRCCGNWTATGTSGCATPPTSCSTGCASTPAGFPRALEAVKAILDGDETLTPRDLLDRTRQLPEDQVVQVLVGEAYELLDGRRSR